MKIIATTIAITMLLLASVSEAQPEPQQSSRCMGFPPMCPMGQHPICMCQNDYSLNCMWMCGSAR